MKPDDNNILASESIDETVKHSIDDFAKAEVPQLPPDAFEFVQAHERIVDAKFESKPMGYFKDAALRFAQNKASIVAAIIMLILVIMAIIGPIISNFTYREQNLRATNLPPRIPVLENFVPFFRGHRDITIQARNLHEHEHTYIRTLRSFETLGVEMLEIRIHGYRAAGFEDVYYWFGSDALGRCLFTRTWYGLRISLLLGLLVSTISIVIGVVYGAIQGYFGGTTDLIMQRITEILGAIPTIMIITVFIMLFGASFRVLVFAFSFLSWVGPAFNTRMQFYRFKNREYVYAANTMGASDWRIIFRHVLPNAVGTLVTIFALAIPTVILQEAIFAFLGLGLQAPTPTLGILNVEGQGALLSSPHIILFPAMVISILLICFNIFGNGLRDAFNPSLRGS